MQGKAIDSGIKRMQKPMHERQVKKYKWWEKQQPGCTLMYLKIVRALQCTQYCLRFVRQPTQPEGVYLLKAINTHKWEITVEQAD